MHGYFRIFPKELISEIPQTSVLRRTSTGLFGPTDKLTSSFIRCYEQHTTSDELLPEVLMT